MSVAYGVDCLDCGVHGPDVGDGGYLGGPALECRLGFERYGESMPSFGYLYEPLAALGMLEYDLEEFRSFLENHRSHRLWLSSDHDDAGDLPAELLVMQDEESAVATHAWEAARRRRRERTQAGEFVEAIYDIVCHDHAYTHAGESPGLLRPFTPFEIPQTTVELFLERWRDLEEGWGHRLSPPVDPSGLFMERLPEFFKLHSGCRLEARLRRVGPGVA